MVYFAQPSNDSSFVKIGFSDNVAQRLVTLGSDFGCEPILLASIPGGREREREIHQQFSEFRVSGSERFHSNPALMRFIRKCAKHEAARVGGKPVREWKSIRIRSDVYARLKILAIVTDQDISETASTLLLNAADPLVDAALRKQYPDVAKKF